jgi:hypothetical protein
MTINCSNEARGVMTGENIPPNEKRRDDARPGQTDHKSPPNVGSRPVQQDGRAAPLRMPLFRS